MLVIVAGKRTAIGSFLGALSPLAAHQFAAPLIAALLKSAGLAEKDFEKIGEVILGQILTAAQGQGPARQARHGCRVAPNRARHGYQFVMRVGAQGRGRRA